MKQDVCMLNNFITRHLLNKKTFERIHNRLVETGSFKKRISVGGRPRSTRTPNLDERTLNHIEDNRGSSTRDIAALENVNHMAVRRILREPSNSSRSYLLTTKLRSG
ncbi:hypothetical protein ANN_23680 [Periplaneta americana]|uniref:Uncharacterized protein n=1 Tax=Periplaneta americana TaxID=6978 RepID=A0ABQ8SNU3_PERAM|nr:hypothetical protein ANN_23680 [Periplaneta americana]